MKRRLSVVRAPGGSSGRGAGSQPAGGASAPLAGLQLSLFPTGTEGPRPAAAGSRKRRGGIPLNVAFREVARFVAAELAAAGEQWDDNAKQAAVCTLLKGAAESGWLTVWERAA